ncbi:UDP-N-acetyl-D-glucosamine 6-dehydrogenase [Actinomadura rubteroloni]|uniref:UDP-N-acetyl-D-glucosamine 6-dehydrogenase n=1 Tax=Actinomadura rubteroloni TaxID=1926885 RepID=A0A2P4UL33_9ACTN|nr:nucleotide sugar dehydrogenase [Actinomadura rubteroloni]POM25767.1 UDP-N-acetyl-D-glucosamine 6-dehydrogenase [Actinomadura rubteroloni]
MNVDLVVVGLGYVGLPLAREAVRAGLSVAGLDRDAGLVAALRAGRSHVDDVPAADVADMLARGFHPTDDAGVVAGASTVVICVPTPLSNDQGPDLTAVIGATRSVASHLRSGTLVVLESTTYPGTTDEVVKPLLEATGLTAGTDFHLAFSPERIDPGNDVYGVRNTPKVVGGLTPACAEAAAAFYGTFVDEVVRAKGTREAEMAKLLENTYRHVNIALVNEMAVFCHELGIDLWDAIDAATTKPFGFQAFRPGPGVGGHCIPIDPNYLSYKVRSLGYPFRFVELAQEINDRMPRYVADRAQQMLNREGRALNGARILLLGVTYKADIADQRESPALPVARRLLALGAELSFHDPYVTAWSVDGASVPAAELETGLADADLTILLQRHRAYDTDLLADGARLLLDTRGAVPSRPGVEAL